MSSRGASKEVNSDDGPMDRSSKRSSMSNEDWKE